MARNIHWFILTTFNTKCTANYLEEIYIFLSPKKKKKMESITVALREVQNQIIWSK